MKLLKNTGIIFLAVVVAVLLIMLTQQINLLLFPLPDWVDVNNPEHLAEVMTGLPVAALLMVELSYIVGSLGAGMLLAKLMGDKCLVHVVIVGVLLTLAGLVNLMSVPHPLWLAIVTTVTYLPMTYAGSRLSRG